VTTLSPYDTGAAHVPGSRIAPAAAAGTREHSPVSWTRRPPLAADLHARLPRPDHRDPACERPTKARFIAVGPSPYGERAFTRRRSHEIAGRIESAAPTIDSRSLIERPRTTSRNTVAHDARRRRAHRAHALWRQKKCRARGVPCWNIRSHTRSAAFRRRPARGAGERRLQRRSASHR